MSTKFPHPLPGDRGREKIIENMVRVDHAGEYGAQKIYDGSIDACHDLQYYRLLHKMRRQEQEHLQYFASFMLGNRVRPTLMIGIWHHLSYLMGYLTYKMGKKSSMICTIAVEEVIIKHYNQQIENCNALGLQDSEITRQIEKFCADEIEHMYTAQDNIVNSKAGGLLYITIQKITRLAIFISKKI